MFDVREYCKQETRSALEETGRHKGRAKAYQDIADHLDPEKFCLDCNTRYYNWEGSRREEHEAKCTARAKRLAEQVTPTAS